MDTHQIIRIGTAYLKSRTGHSFDLLDVAKPKNQEAALNLAKIISKLSPLLGNLIEFDIVNYLNEQPEFDGLGYWERQDPGFPDTVFRGVSPTPGFEIKTWFPLATEITARFKDSQSRFQNDATYVAILAWIPEFLIYGRPKIINICVVSGLSIAIARDAHYHNPPDYIILEPEDTRLRTKNLQQTNTTGHKFQGTDAELLEAKEIVASWGKNGKKYAPNLQYQNKIRQLISRFKYRLDTNYAKMDRIVHDEIEFFKSQVYETDFLGMKIADWKKLLVKGNEADIKSALAKHLLDHKSSS